MKSGDYTLFKEKSMKEKEKQSETASVRRDLVSRQVGRYLGLPKNEGDVRKCCWGGEQMVPVALC